MNEVKPIDKLLIKQDGRIFLKSSARQIYPSKNGDFLDVKYDDIIAVYATQEFKKAVDKQIRHAKLSFDQLVEWKSDSENKKSDARKQGKTPYYIQSMSF